MSWVGVGVGGGTALLGMMNQADQQRQQAKQQQANMMANAAAIQYSPWTGMKTGMMAGEAVPNDVLGTGAQAGLQGYAFGRQFAKAAQAPTPAAKTASSGAVKPTIYSVATNPTFDQFENTADQHDKYKIGGGGGMYGR